MAKITGADVPTTLPQSEEEEERRAMGVLDNSGILDNSEKEPRNSDRFETEVLRGLATFEEARQLASLEWGAELDASHEIGTGFRILNGTEKDRLLGQDFVILSFDFNPGTGMGPFVSMLVVDVDNRKFIINDGSTGVYAQLDKFHQARPEIGGGIMVKGGLRKSEYDNEFGHGITYYLNV